MPPEETVAKSPLDKSLHLLTEDDISQLTREDCRRYLKEKGMRRPSWNKSQAIQQVISLKALFETPPDSDTGTRKKLHIPRPHTSSTVQRVQKGTENDAQFAEPPEETVRFGRMHQNNTDLSGDVAAGSVYAVNELAPSRTTDSATTPAGQMTIFYCGKVNVYDDVPAEKAQAIMHLAASPPFVPSETPLGASVAARHTDSRLQAANVKLGPDSAVVLMPTMQTVKMSEVTRLHLEESNTFFEENSVEGGPASRKASVQRFLEKKRKDRLKSKRKVGTSPSAGLDIYLNHRTGSHTPNELSSRSNTCSPPTYKLSAEPTPSGSMDNNLQLNANTSTFFDDKDAQE